MSLHLTVGREGDVTSAVATRVVGLPDTLVACAIERARAAQFMPESKIRQVHIPVVFRPPKPRR